MRQETTMAKARTLPEPAYNLDLVPINQSFIQIENTSPVEKRHEDEDDNEDEMIEYESDSENDEIDNTSDGNMQFSEVSRHSTFLIGGDLVEISGLTIAIFIKMDGLFIHTPSFLYL